MRRDYVASTLIRRHFGTKCPLGAVSASTYQQLQVIIDHHAYPSNERDLSLLELASFINLILDLQMSSAPIHKPNRRWTRHNKDQIRTDNIFVMKRFQTMSTNRQGAFLEQTAWPRGYKTFFMLNSVEHEILNAQ